MVRLDNWPFGVTVSEWIISVPCYFYHPVGLASLSVAIPEPEERERKKEWGHNEGGKAGEKERERGMRKRGEGRREERRKKRGKKGRRGEEWREVASA